jgi:hypothetical protein
VSLVRSVARTWQLDALVELAQRSPDDSLGRDRALGPRALFELGASHALLPVLRLGGYSELALEGDTSYDGMVAQGSSQRLWTVALFAVQELPSIDARTSLSLEHAPALDGAGRNSIGNTALTVGFSLSR